jgi:hypothetical protein
MATAGRTRFPELRDIPDAAADISTRLAERVRADRDDCVVCLEELQTDLIVLPCDHILHYECLRNWHRTDLGFGIADVSGTDAAASNRCATCRQRYDVSDLRKLPAAPSGRRDDGGDGDDDGGVASGSGMDPDTGPVVPAHADPNKWEFDEVHGRAIELIEEHLAKDEGKAIVFLNQNSAMRLHAFLRARGVSFVNCIEAGSEESRARSIAEFVNGTPDVLLIDPKSETGLNLTVANFVLNYAGHDGSYDQIVGRVRRLGQRHVVRVVQMRVNTVHLRAVM